MKWTVEVTHTGSGEEMHLGVEAATREQAAAVARDGGFLVRDCYRAGRELYKGARAVAWVSVGVFAPLTITAALCGFGGCFATPGDSGVKEGLATAGFAGALAPLGFFVARAMSAALRRDPPLDARRGFEVVQTNAADKLIAKAPTTQDSKTLSHRWVADSHR